MHSAITTATKNQAARPIGIHHHVFTFPPVVTGLCNQVLLRTVTLQCHIVGNLAGAPVDPAEALGAVWHPRLERA
jgi:hypothetical protein